MVLHAKWSLRSKSTGVVVGQHIILFARYYIENILMRNQRGCTTSNCPGSEFLRDTLTMGLPRAWGFALSPQQRNLRGQCQDVTQNELIWKVALVPVPYFPCNAFMV